MAKYFCHEDTKTQRNIQKKFVLSAFVSWWQRQIRKIEYHKYSIFNFDELVKSQNLQQSSL